MRVKGVAATLVVAIALAGALVGSSDATVPGTQVILQGRIVDVHTDDFAAARSTNTYVLETTHGTYRLQLPGQDPQIPRTTTVDVEGVARGPDVSVAANQLAPAAGSRSLAAVTGAKKLAVILFTFSDDTTQPYTPDFARGIAFTNSTSVAAYYRDVSWGQLSLTGDVLGWYSIPDMSTSCNYEQWAADADQAAEAAGVDLSAYDYKAYGFPWVAACGWTGLADMPGTQSWLNGWQGMTLGSMAHELGHNLGSHHANSYNCTANGVRVALSTPSNCTSTEYGDPFSVMGSSSRYDQTNFSRASIGWLPMADTRDVSASGVYSLDAIEPTDPAGGVQAIRIKRDASTYLLLELREPYGTFDDFSPTAPVVNGVTIRIVPSYSTITQSQLVDTTPATSTYTDAALTVGQSITDPVSGVTITTLGIGPLGASVQISFSSGSDTQPPSTPSGLTATGTDASHAQLGWSASTDNVGVTGYRVYRGGAYVATTTSTSYTDGGLSAGTAYSYDVTAVDAAGNESAPSNTATATTPAAPVTDTTPPSAPTGLTATELDVNDVKFSWSPSIDNVGVTGYKVYRGGTYVATSTTTGYTDSGLKPNTSYSYYVTAVDAAGNASAHSATAGAKTTDAVAPGAPTGLTATETDVHHIALSWTGSTDNVGVTGYRIYRNGRLVKTVTSTSYTDSSLTPSTTYSYDVTARDAAGNESAASNTASATTLDTTPPTAPVLTAKVANTTNAALSWSASSDNVKVAGYYVYRNGALLATISAGTRSYTDKNAPSGTDTYVVVAFDAAGNVNQSNAVGLGF